MARLTPAATLAAEGPQTSAGWGSLRTALRATLLALCVGLVACTSLAPSGEPGAFDTDHTRIPIRNREVAVTYVKPVQPQHPGYFIVFATGDGGWFGTNTAVFTHLAERGYLMAGLSSPEVLNRSQKPRRRLSPTQATATFADLFARVRRDLDVGSSASMIVVGFSRGASIAAYTAINQRLHVGLAGAVAIGLTREDDYVRAPTGRRRHELSVDDQGRLELYPPLAAVTGTRLAIIQSTADHYVAAAESRELLGPDTASRRLYTVQARNHRFGGGRDALLNDLDEALDWIEQKAPPQTAAP